MARYRITFKRSVKTDLRKIENRQVAVILKRIDALADDPRPSGCKKLAGKDVYRVRQGSYRIIYEIFDGRLLVVVVAIGSRGGVY